MKNKAVFLDRDGTINIDVHYLDDPDNFTMYPGVGEGVKTLKDHGFKIIIITNQSGIGRGYFSEAQLSAIHERMIDIFRNYDVRVDDIFYCPHHPDDQCSCRKPHTGLFEKAILRHDIDAARSFMIGDKSLDIEAGKKMGTKTILIPEPHVRNTVLLDLKTWKIQPDLIADNFRDAVEWVITTDNKADCI